jgi:hypothetical protein
MARTRRSTWCSTRLPAWRWNWSKDDVDVRRVAEEGGVHGARGRLRVLAAYHDRDGAFGGALRNHLDVDPGRGNRRQEPRGDAPVMLHALADQGHHGAIGLDAEVLDQAVQALEMEFLFQRFTGLPFVGAPHAQRDAVLGGRLHDQQDRDGLAGQRIHHAARDADAAAQAAALQGNRRDVVQVGDAAHDVRPPRLAVHPRARPRRVVGVAHLAGDVVRGQRGQRLG